MTFGERVKHERKRQGLTRDELTAKMPEDSRMHPNTLWHIEAGKTKHPRIDHVMAIASALGMSSQVLLTGTDEAHARKTSRVRRSLDVED
jgi:transcriptional regulator with XRE-family HTH domain